MSGRSHATGKLVSSLIHPTEIPEIQFNFDRFIENNNKKIVQIGWWLRKLTSIYQLTIPQSNSLNYTKIRLVPIFGDNARELLNNNIQKESDICAIEKEPLFWENTQEIEQLNNEEYDRLLSKNIAFVELYDSSANNAIIECIARATPLLINPLPAIVEYLGEDYPFYFTSLAEAAEKALDTSLILDTHNYLKNCEMRNKLSADYFLHSFKNSEVYRSI